MGEISRFTMAFSPSNRLYLLKLSYFHEKKRWHNSCLSPLPRDEIKDVLKFLREFHFFLFKHCS